MNIDGLSDHDVVLITTIDGLSDDDVVLITTIDRLSDHDVVLLTTIDGLSDHDVVLITTIDGLSDHDVVLITTIPLGLGFKLKKRFSQLVRLQQMVCKKNFMFTIACLVLKKILIAIRKYKGTKLLTGDRF